MHTWREEYASFRMDGCEWQKIREVQILGNNTSKPMTGEEMVIIALKFAKQHKCRIRSRVIYTKDIMGGSVTVEIECNNRTTKSIYEHGSYCYGNNNPTITERDISRYEAEFETKKCFDETFRKSYWYKDNWTGEIHHFSSLNKAVKSAQQEIGNCIYIYTNHPYGRNSELIKVQEASGRIPP